MYLLLQITIRKSYKLNTTIIYTKMTNNHDIRQFFKKFHNDDTEKGSLMMILKIQNGSLMMILKMMIMILMMIISMMILKKFKKDP